jgi:MFS family permease
MFGPRRTLIRIVLWWSAFTALTGTIYPIPGWPWYAFSAMLVVRFLFGMGEAGAYPNIARAFYNWFPFTERGFAQGAVWMAGRFMGGLSPLAVLALMYHVTSPTGEVVTHWRHTFWIFGVLGVIWCIAFWWWFRDRPDQHPAVNAAELAFIQGHRPQLPSPDVTQPPEYAKPDVEPRTDIVAESARTGLREDKPLRLDGGQAEESAGPGAQEGTEGHAGDTHSHRNVPWGKLLGSVNLWTLCLMYFGGAYGWYFNITWLPKYLDAQYGVTEKTHGFWVMSLLSGAPLLLGSLACLLGGLLTDWFIRRTGNRKWGRRLFGMVGHGVCAGCYFLSMLAPTPWLFVLAVALAAFWNDLTMGAAWASCLDIGGKYSGIVSGCMNTVGNLGGAVAGITTGWILDQFGRQLGWQINLASFGTVYVIAVFLWLRFDATKPVAPEAV